MRLWPRSLATRTAMVLLAGLVVVQSAGLLVYASDRLDLQHLAQLQDTGARLGNLYRAVATAGPGGRDAALREADPATGLDATIDPAAASTEWETAPPPVQRAVRVSMQTVQMPGMLRWRELSIRAGPERRLLASMRLPGTDWLNVRIAQPRLLPFWSERFVLAIALMTAAAALLVVWAVRQFTAPMRELALAAERLGTDVNASPLPGGGTTEAAKAAAAFNVMAARIRRYVQDRTFLLTAIGHDLRTPITRLKLRAEWMDDDEQRRKMLADLDELESMVAATLAFGRDDANRESPTALDLAELLRTVLEAATDARPEAGDIVGYAGPAHHTVRARPVALKRALTNLVGNALNYGGDARVTLQPERDGGAVVIVDDSGPGIPPGELDRVFEPFHRLEPSRNRETGGTGLGLPIARNILRAHGGDVLLANRPGGGLRATVTLPA